MYLAGKDDLKVKRPNGNRVKLEVINLHIRSKNQSVLVQHLLRPNAKRRLLKQLVESILLALCGPRSRHRQAPALGLFHHLVYLRRQTVVTLAVQDHLLHVEVVDALERCDVSAHGVLLEPEDEVAQRKPAFPVVVLGVVGVRDAHEVGVALVDAELVDGVVGAVVGEEDLVAYPALRNVGVRVHADRVATFSGVCDCLGFVVLGGHDSGQHRLVSGGKTDECDLRPFCRGQLLEASRRLVYTT